MLQYMFVQGLRNLQPTDEYECRDILTAERNFGQLALAVADIALEAIALPHFDSEKVVIVLLGLPTRGVLSEKYFSYLLEIMKEMWQKRVEAIRGHAFQMDRNVSGLVSKYAYFVSPKALRLSFDDD